MWHYQDLLVRSVWRWSSCRRYYVAGTPWFCTDFCSKPLNWLQCINIFLKMRRIPHRDCVLQMWMNKGHIKGCQGCWWSMCIKTTINRPICFLVFKLNSLTQLARCHPRYRFPSHWDITQALAKWRDHTAVHQQYHPAVRQTHPWGVLQWYTSTSHNRQF